jgi:hypothetical protein
MVSRNTLFRFNDFQAAAQIVPENAIRQTAVILS